MKLSILEPAKPAATAKARIKTGLRAGDMYLHDLPGSNNHVGESTPPAKTH